MSFDKSFANNERLVFYPKFFRRFFGLLPAASILIGIGFLAEFMMIRSGDYYGSAKRGADMQLPQLSLCGRFMS